MKAFIVSDSFFISRSAGNNCTYCLYGAGSNDFDAGISITKALERGGL